MATEDQHLYNISSSMDKIVRHMSAMGSPAQIKKQQEQRAETVEQDAKNVKDESDLIEDQEDNAKESRVLFAGTMRAGVHIWQNLSTNIFSKMKDVFGGLMGQVREALGPVAAFYDAAKQSFMGMFDMVKGVFMSFKATPTEKKQLGFLGTIANFAKMSMKQMKGEFLQTIGEEKKKGGKWAAIMFILGAVIGGIIAALLKPFNLLGSVIKMISTRLLKIPFFGKAFERLGKFFRSIKAFVKNIPKMGKMGAGLGKVWKFFKAIGGFVKSFLSKIPGLTSLFKGLKFGFKFLGWPIAIIFGIIDFIRGFVKEYGESGSVIESIKAGLTTAIIGFIELPVKMIGWLIDKVLSFVTGGEVKGSADKIMGYIKWLVGMYFKWVEFYVFTPLKLIGSLFKWLWDLVGPWMSRQLPKLKAMAELFFTAISGLWEWIGEIGRVILERFGINVGGPEVPNSPQKQAEIAEAERRAKLKQLDEEARKEKRLELERKNREEWQKKQEAAQKALLMSNTLEKSGGGDFPQIPDEVDNWGITSKNYDMEMVG